jgi:hypothetical protein
MEARSRPQEAQVMDDFRILGKRLTNWGRWDTDGQRDERGTNLLTPERGQALRILPDRPAHQVPPGLGPPVNPLAIK